MTATSMPVRRARPVQTRVVVGLGTVILAILVATVLATIGANPASTVEVRPMDQALESALRAQGIEVAPVSTSTKVTADEAAEVARAELPALISDANAQVSLVTFTDASRGEELPDGTLDVTYEDKVAWAVVLKGVEVPLFGPNVDERKVESYQGTLVTFVDTESGAFLEAIAVSL